MDLITAVVTLLLPIILFQLNFKFQYLVKMFFWYLCLLIISTVLPFLFILSPGNPENNRIIMDFGKFLCKWVSIKYEVRGKENLDNGKSVVIVANHQSSFDLRALAEIWPKRCVSLIKKPLMYAATFGICAKLAGNTFIDRHYPNKAKATVDACLLEIKKKKTNIIIFPEGKRNSGEDGMLPFKKGAFHLAIQGGFPIVPVVISSYRPFFSSKYWKWLPRGYVIIEVLSPICTEGLAFDDVNKLLEDTRCQMLETWERITAEVEKRFDKGDF